MGKNSNKRAKKPKKAKHPVDAAVAGARATAPGRRAGAAREALEEGRQPDCLRRLADADPQVREGALGDVTNLILVPSQARVLASFGAPAIIANLLCNDEIACIRSAAACALRNVIITADASNTDAMYPNPNYDLVGGIVRAIGTAMSTVTNLLDNPPPPEIHDAPVHDNEAGAAAVAENDDGEGGDEPDATPAQTIKENYDANLAASYQDIDEFLQLATVLAESNDAAAQALTLASTNFLPMLLHCLQCTGAVAVQQSASECLKVLAEDSDAVSTFMGTDATPEMQEALDGFVKNIPSSPSLLRVSANVCAALLNMAPSVDNVREALPVLVTAVSTSTLQTVQRLAPLLSAECSLDANVRRMGVTQHLDRLRAMQAALQGLTDALSIVCEEQDDEAEDEVAFAQNPAAQIIISTPLLPKLIERAAEVMIPLADPILIAVLQQPSNNGDITTLQRIMSSLEVGVLGLTSSFMMLLPLNAFGGSVSTLWNLVVNAISQRHERLNEAWRVCRSVEDHGVDDSDASGEGNTEAASMAANTGLLCLPLQLESLSEMAATIQRKDAGGESAPQPPQLDVFTQLAWNPQCSTATRSHIVVTLSRMSTRVQDPQLTNTVGNFCSKVLQRATELIQESTQAGSAPDADAVDVAAEVLDALMDIFSSEDFDQSCYVPLRIDDQIRTFLPIFKQYLGAMKGSAKKGSAAWLRKRHLEEIASNTVRFLQYKKDNISSVAPASPSGAAAAAGKGRR